MHIYNLHQSVSGSSSTNPFHPHPTTFCAADARCAQKKSRAWIGVSLLTAAVLTLRPGLAQASQQIDELFQQFDQLAATAPDIRTPENPENPEVQTSPTCTMHFADAHQKINALVQVQGPLEKKVLDLNERFYTIIAAMPRVGANEGACTKRMQRDIASFREDIAALQLDAMREPVEAMIGCVVSFRQQVTEKEQHLETSQSNNQIAEKLKLNKQKKAITDLDFKRNELAVFLDQVDGRLTRRLSEIAESEEINCSEGDVF